MSETTTATAARTSAEPAAEPDFDLDRTDRRPPQDLDAEMAVLGACMLSDDAAEEVVGSGLKEIDFYAAKHATIYAAIVGMYESGTPIDPVTVADRLRELGDLRRVGGPGYLHILHQAPPAAATAGHYAQIVQEQALLRRLVAAGTRIVQMGYAADGGDPSEIIDAAQAEILAVGTGVDQIGENIAADLEGVLTRVETGVNVMATPWADLNEVIGGWVRGNLYVFGARPGDGKSISGLQAALHMAAHHGTPACFVSLEMTKDQIAHRILSQVGGINLSHLAKGGDEMTDDDWARAIAAQDRLSTAGPDGGPYPLHVVDTSAATLSSIRSAYRATARRYGVAPGLLVVDYLQLMHGTGRHENRQVLISMISQGLKELAKELDVAMVALSQLRRPSGEQDRKPAMEDLRESGAIEQAADVIVLLYRPKDGDGQYDGTIDYMIVKNRQGYTSTVSLRWEAWCSRILCPPRVTNGTISP